MQRKDKNQDHWLKEAMRRAHEDLYRGTLLGTEVYVVEVRPPEEDGMGRYVAERRRNVYTLKSEEDIPAFLDKYEPNDGWHFAFELHGTFEVLKVEKRRLKTIKPPA